MFNKIFESVLNEISAEDAYNKFYNTLPRDDFFNLVNEYGKFDNLMKFVMNSISNNKNRFEDAMNFVKLYKSAKNEARIAFLKNFKEGKYDDITDLIYALTEFEENGVETLKKFQEGGLVVVRDDEDLKITYTTTYEANHHFYGKSSWCTASDRLGRYDGWIYYLSYIFGMEYLTIIDEYEYLQEDYTIDNCLLQITDKKKGQIYQFQVDEYGEVGTACDFNDKSVSTTLYADIINHLKENGILKGAINETTSSFLKEYPYQRKKDEYIISKRERNERMIAEMEENFRIQSIQFAESKKTFIMQQVDKVFNSNLLENTSFIERIVRFTNKCQNTFEERDEMAQELEEEAKAIGYLYVSSSIMVNDNVFIIKLTPIFGMVKDIVYGQNGIPFFGDIFNDDYWQYEVDLDSQEANLIVETEYNKKNIVNGFHGKIQDYADMKILKILKISKHSNDDIICDMSIISNNINFSKKSYNIDYISIREYKPFPSAQKISLFNLKYNKTFDIDFYPAKKVIYDDFIFILGEGKGILINNKTLEALRMHSVKYVSDSGRACALLFGMSDASFYAGINENDGNLYLFADNVVKIGKIGSDYQAMIPSNQISYYANTRMVPKYLLICDTTDDWKYKYFFKDKKVVKNKAKEVG